MVYAFKSDCKFSRLSLDYKTYFQQAVNGKSRAQIGVLFQDMKTIVAVQTVSAWITYT